MFESELKWKNEKPKKNFKILVDLKCLTFSIQYNVFDL